MIKINDILMTRTRSDECGIGDWYLPNDKKNPSPTTYGVYHVSHSNCVVYKTTNTQDSSLSAEELRIYLIKDLLKIK